MCVPRVQLKIISWSTGQKKHNCFFILFFYIGHFNMCVHTCVLSQILLERVCLCAHRRYFNMASRLLAAHS